MKDSHSDTDPERTIEYSVSVSGDEDDHRAFRELIYRNRAEIQSEMPADRTEEGIPQYLQNLIDRTVEKFEEEDNMTPIDATMDVIIPEVEDLQFEDNIADRTVYDVLYDLNQLKALQTTDMSTNTDLANLSEPNFNHYRNHHSPENPNANQWGKATIKALAHASLEMYIVEKVREIKNVEPGSQR